MEVDRARIWWHPALYAFPNYALGVSCGVFSTSLKSRPEIYDEFSQTQCRPGAPTRYPSTSLDVSYRPKFSGNFRQEPSVRVLWRTAASPRFCAYTLGYHRVTLGYPKVTRFNAALARISSAKRTSVYHKLDNMGQIRNRTGKLKIPSSLVRIQARSEQ
jgi:hypothetical protein